MKSCKQCGTCCRKGGPALHQKDIRLVKDGHLSITNLICIREGEPVFSPLSARIEPAELEIIKISTTNSWRCPFLTTNKNLCVIYSHRPTECRLLKCWDTAEISQVIYHNVLNRWDIIDSDRDITKLLKLHDKECSFKTIKKIADEIKKKGNSESQEKFQLIFAKDLTIRKEAINTFNLSLAEELFYFGRPMFKSFDFFQK